MAIIIVVAAQVFFQNESLGFLGLLIWVISAASGGAVVYFGFAFLFKSSEALAVMDLMKRRFGRNHG